MSPDPVTGVADAVTMLLTIVSKAMDHIPNYDQRKKKEYHMLLTAYEEEKSKRWNLRDDNLVGIYKDRLFRFINTFKDELDVKNKSNKS